MNKKLKIFLALTLVIQLLVPSSLLIYHNSLYAAARSSETEYTIELSYLSFDDSYVYEDSFSEIAEGNMSFEIVSAMITASGKLTPVLSPKNNVLYFQKLKDGNNTDVWLYARNYYNSCSIDTEHFSFVNEAEKGKIKQDIRTEYYQYKKDSEDCERAYLTAKIHKGVFIPTAIYFRGEKIIDISL